MPNNQELNLEQIDEIRKKGLRPQVVGCFVNNKKVLMVYKEKHKLWQLPQGGVDNKEDLLTALQREMQEELGRDFIELVEFLGTEKVMFPKQTQGARELFTDKGKEIKMQGKKYFIYAIKTKITKFDLNKSEFDDFKWLPYDEAIKLSQTIYQKGKKRLTLKSLQLLKDKKLV